MVHCMWKSTWRQKSIFGCNLIAGDHGNISIQNCIFFPYRKTKIRINYARLKIISLQLFRYLWTFSHFTTMPHNMRHIGFTSFLNHSLIQVNQSEKNVSGPIFKNLLLPFILLKWFRPKCFKILTMAQGILLNFFKCYILFLIVLPTSLLDFILIFQSTRMSCIHELQLKLKLSKFRVRRRSSSASCAFVLNE